jgi:hypothetical protein
LSYPQIVCNFCSYIHTFFHKVTHKSTADRTVYPIHCECVIFYILLINNSHEANSSMFHIHSPSTKLCTGSCGQVDKTVDIFRKNARIYNLKINGHKKNLCNHTTKFKWCDAQAKEKKIIIINLCQKSFHEQN